MKTPVLALTVTLFSMLALITALFAIYTTSVSAAEVKAKPETISMEQAKQIALDRMPGEIVDLELEEEHHVWQYSADVKSKEDGLVYDIEISATTGEILHINLDK